MVELVIGLVAGYFIITLVLPPILMFLFACLTPFIWMGKKLFGMKK